ncbi:MAG: methyltransferase domain-containing protein [Gammaproteobacteria bacterium]|nr:methyltransferase domain-containing protein [Gammaproteobacteria bacterium]
MSGADNQPDWQAIAEKFDLWLPQLEPVGEDLLRGLEPFSGDLILDVASGTGEPALTLAKQNPEVTVVGVDAAPAMAAVAQRKVDQAGLTNISFTAMAAESLDFPDSCFDRVLCRFGVMLFADPLKGLQEMHRVLKPSGRVALAVWATAETMTTMHWAQQVLADKLPEALHPPLQKATSLGADGVLDDLILAAGFSEYEIHEMPLFYRFDSFEQYWQLIEASDIMKMQFDALTPEVKNQVRDEVALFAQQYQESDGLVIPHAYLLAVAMK